MSVVWGWAKYLNNDSAALCRRVVFALTTATVCAQLTGCTAALRGRPGKMPNAHLSELVKKYSTDTWFAAYEAQVKTDPDEAKTLRDGAIYDLLLIANGRYDDFEGDFNSGVAIYDSVSDVVSLGLTSAATVIKPAGTKAVLAAISTFVTGANGKINNDVLNGKSRTVIISQMRADRATVLARIVTGQAKPISQYSLEEALVDVDDYFLAGTVVSALNGLSAAAAVKGNDAQNEIKTIKRTELELMMAREKVEIQTKRYRKSRTIKEAGNTARG